MRRCKHLWQEASRSYTPPSADLKRLSGRDSDLVKTVLYGMTVVELHCVNCGDVEFRSTPGKASS